MGLYMVGFISYGATLVFYAALFPRLARNTAHARALKEKYDAGVIPREVYEVEESLEKNRISNISTVSASCGQSLGHALMAAEADAQQCGVYCDAVFEPHAVAAVGG